MESSFEAQGRPFIDGWQDRDSISIKNRSFINDAPINNGQWSIKIVPPETLYSRLFRTILFTQPSRTNKYLLTYWFKTSENFDNYTVLTNSYGGNQLLVVSRNRSSTTWTKDSIAIQLHTIALDSLVVAIEVFSFARKPSSVNYVQLDGFKLTEY
jgi:hypothetical protein